ncbi:MAG: response regulator [Myxococcota bacterium]|nr:response regulator [Myxococcota bacterium]
MEQHTVLFVDDEVGVLDGLKRALRKEPYTFLTAESGQDALDILAETNVDVLVSDENMPGMKGSELLAKVKEDYPDTIRIVLTGQASVESAMRAIYDGWVYQYLHKPVNAADLAAAIHNGLLLQSLRMEGESPHLVMSPNQQNELLNQFSDAGEAVNAPVDDITPPQEIDAEPVSPANDEGNITAAMEEIRAALDDAESSDNVPKLVDLVRNAIDKIAPK